MSNIAPSDVRERFDDLLFHVHCSIKYHARRRRFFENVNNAALFVAFLFSTATMSSLLDTPAGASGLLAFLGELPAVATSVLIGISLVGRVGTKANDHNDLKRRFIRLQQRMERERGEVNEAAVGKLVEERLAIEADEPPINRVVQARCYNEVVKSLKTVQDTDKRFIKIRWWHRTLGWLTRAFDDGLDLGAAGR